MKKGTKKPWLKVGKLERRIDHLEQRIETVRNNEKIDFEELNKRIEELNSGLSIIVNNMISDASQAAQDIARILNDLSERLRGNKEK